MHENIFNDFQIQGATKLKAYRPRKFLHSTSNWFSAKRQNKATDNAVNFGKSTAEFVVGDGASLTGAGIGIATIVQGGLVTGVAAGGVAGAIISGPILAGLLGLIGLGVMIKGTYSNRDDAHYKLGPFVYNLITDKAPTNSIYTNPEHLETAAKHAGYLLKDAPNQFALMGPKLHSKQKAFTRRWAEYLDLTSWLHGYRWAWTKNYMRDYEIWARSAKPTEVGSVITDHHIKLNTAITSGSDLLTKHAKQGGDIFEYMRRLIKVGNYLQCANIVSLATYSKLNFNENTNQAATDPFITWAAAKGFRDDIDKMSKTIVAVEANYKEWERFATVHKAA